MKCFLCADAGSMSSGRPLKSLKVGGGSQLSSDVNVVVSSMGQRSLRRLIVLTCNCHCCVHCKLCTETVASQRISAG